VTIIPINSTGEGFTEEPKPGEWSVEMNHRPIAIGMVLCEQLIVEECTHNITPVNCFSIREVEELPDRVTFFVLA